MAILDTFYLLFKSNADDAKRGMDDAERGTKKFDEQLGRTDEHVRAAGEKIVETFTEVGVAIVAAFSVERLGEFLHETLEINAALQDTSERLGLAVEDLASLQSIGKRFGGSAEGVIGTIDFLNKGLEDIAVKGTSRLKPFFDELKINALDAHGKVKPVVEIIKELSDAFSHHTAQERSGLAERFGIDQGLLLAMAEGRRGLEDLIQRQKELGVTTERDAELADIFEKKLDDLQVVFHHVGNVLLSGVLPALTAVVDRVTEFVVFLRSHENLVTGFFIGIGTVISAVYLPAIVRAAIATLAFIAEWLLIPAMIAAVVAALAFLYDDVMAFLNGQKSVIGELTKRWPIVGEVVREVAKGVGEAFEWLLGAMKGSINLGISLFNLLVSAISTGSKFISNLFKGLAAVSNEFWQGFAKAFPLWAEGLKGIGKLLEWIVGLMAKALTWFGKLGFDAVQKLPKALDKWAGNIDAAATSLNPGGTHLAMIGAGQGYLATAAATPLGSVSNTAIGGRTSSKNVTVKVDKIEVQTQATDAQGVAGAVGDRLADHIRQAVNHHDDGVDG